MANLVQMRGITKRFSGVPVLTGVDFSIDRGEIVALCGENGAGKSTLMKILAAVYRADEGEISLDGEKLTGNLVTLDMQKKGVSMIHQELNLMEHLTVAQNIFLTREPKTKLGLIDFKKMNADAKALLESLGQNISPTARISELKIAQKQMVEIAKAISFNVKVLIMDEPTSMLTSRETDILFDLVRRLSKQGLGIIYISHRLKEIKDLCTRVIILRDGQFVFTAPVEDVSEQDIANHMVGREVSISQAGDFEGDPKDIILEVRNVNDSLLKNASFKVARGEIVGFSGLVGSGRSELMEVIFGIRKAQGEVILNGKAIHNKRPAQAIQRNIGFVTEDRQRTGVVVRRSIRENINLIDQIKNKRFVIHSRAQQNNTSDMIGQLRIRCASQNQLVSNLSGGNQQKIVIAKWLLVDPDILILDEPTRGIDVGARAEIYEIIRKIAAEGKTVIVVSSDMTEILQLCQRIIVMHEGEIKGELTGDDRTEEKIMAFAVNASQAEEDKQ